MSSVLHSELIIPDFKLELTDFSAAKTAEFKDQHQPFGQIPYLVDTEAGIEVFEARAIAKCRCFVEP